MKDVNEKKQYCTFYLENQLIGVDALKVQEITPMKKITKVPKAPDFVRGLINLRGQLVTVIDLRHKFNMGPCPNEDEQMNIITNVHDSTVSLQVDRIGEVIDVNLRELETPPPNLEKNYQGQFEGIYKLENELLAIIDLDRCTGLMKKEES